MKTRYAKPFESVQVKIPYETGMDPYSGLIDLFEAKDILKKSGNRLEYTSPVTGEVMLEYRKAWTGDKLQIIMNDIINTPVVDTPVDDEVEEVYEEQPTE